MTDAEISEQVLAQLEPLFEEAMRLDLWFYCSYQAMWFSPAELHEEHARGRCVWGKVNWTLRDPHELLTHAQDEVLAAQRRFNDVQQRIAKWQKEKGL